MTIEQSFIEELATSLSIQADELLRPLLETELKEWSFYRASAQNRQVVWDNAVNFARHNNRSLREMAVIIAMQQPDMQFAISGKRPRVFELQHAQRLTSIANPPADPSILLPAETGTPLERG